MDILQAIKERHSVRTYTDKPLSRENIDMLIEEIAKANYEGDLDIQLRVEEPEAFIAGLATYGWFKGAKNYMAMVGSKSVDLDERIGYFGERIVLAAQQTGLNTCWIGASYNKKKMGAVVKEGQACPAIIAIGYGADQGKPHKVKDLEKLCLVEGRKVEHISNLPRWFTFGLECAQLAPTAINQQRFLIDLTDGEDGNKVRISTKFGPFTQMDLGIAKYHFEVGANSISPNWSWV